MSKRRSFLANVDPRTIDFNKVKESLGQKIRAINSYRPTNYIKDYSEAGSIGLNEQADVRSNFVLEDTHQRVSRESRRPIYDEVKDIPLSNEDTNQRSLRDRRRSIYDEVKDIPLSNEDTNQRSLRDRRRPIYDEVKDIPLSNEDTNQRSLRDRRRSIYDEVKDIPLSNEDTNQRSLRDRRRPIYDEVKDIPLSNEDTNQRSLRDRRRSIYDEVKDIPLSNEDTNQRSLRDRRRSIYDEVKDIPLSNEDTNQRSLRDRRRPIYDEVKDIPLSVLENTNQRISKEEDINRNNTSIDNNKFLQEDFHSIHREKRYPSRKIPNQEVNENTRINSRKYDPINTSISPSHGSLETINNDKKVSYENFRPVNKNNVYISSDLARRGIDTRYPQPNSDKGNLDGVESKLDNIDKKSHINNLEMQSLTGRIKRISEDNEHLKQQLCNYNADLKQEVKKDIGNYSFTVDEKMHSVLSKMEELKQENRSLKSMLENHQFNITKDIKNVIGDSERPVKDTLESVQEDKNQKIYDHIRHSNDLLGNEIKNLKDYYTTKADFKHSDNDSVIKDLIQYKMINSLFNDNKDTNASIKDINHGHYFNNKTTKEDVALTTLDILNKVKLLTTDNTTSTNKDSHFITQIITDLKNSNQQLHDKLEDVSRKFTDIVVDNKIPYHKHVEHHSIHQRYGNQEIEYILNNIQKQQISLQQLVSDGVFNALEKNSLIIKDIYPLFSEINNRNELVLEFLQKGMNQNVEDHHQNIKVILSKIDNFENKSNKLEVFLRDMTSFLEDFKQVILDEISRNRNILSSMSNNRETGEILDILEDLVIEFNEDKKSINVLNNGFNNYKKDLFKEISIIKEKMGALNIADLSQFKMSIVEYITSLENKIEESLQAVSDENLIPGHMKESTLDLTKNTAKNDSLNDVIQKIEILLGLSDNSDHSLEIKNIPPALTSEDTTPQKVGVSVDNNIVRTDSHLLSKKKIDVLENMNYLQKQINKKI